MLRPRKKDEKLFCELYLLKNHMTERNFMIHVYERCEGMREGVANGLITILFQKNAHELFKELNKKYKVEPRF